MNPRLVNGWIVVDTDAPDQSIVEIGVLSRTSKAFLPAFRDYDDGKRVAKVKHTGDLARAVVYLRVDGVEHMAGNLSL